jgi:hypothetical protein
VCPITNKTFKQDYEINPLHGPSKDIVESDDSQNHTQHSGGVANAAEAAPAEQELLNLDTLFPHLRERLDLGLEQQFGFSHPLLRANLIDFVLSEVFGSSSSQPDLRLDLEAGSAQSCSAESTLVGHNPILDGHDKIPNKGKRKEVGGQDPVLDLEASTAVVVVESSCSEAVEKPGNGANPDGEAHVSEPFMFDGLDIDASQPHSQESDGATMVHVPDLGKLSQIEDAEAHEVDITDWIGHWQFTDIDTQMPLVLSDSFDTDEVSGVGGVDQCSSHMSVAHPIDPSYGR